MTIFTIEGGVSVNQQSSCIAQMKFVLALFIEGETKTQTPMHLLVYLRRAKLYHLETKTERAEYRLSSFVKFHNLYYPSLFVVVFPGINE